MFLWGVSLRERHLKYLETHRVPRLDLYLKNFHLAWMSTRILRRESIQKVTLLQPPEEGRALRATVVNRRDAHAFGYWIVFLVGWGSKMNTGAAPCTLSCGASRWDEESHLVKVSWVMRDIWLSSSCNSVFCSSLKSRCSTFCITQCIVLTTFWACV